MFQITTEEKSEVVANCDHLQRLKFSSALPNAFTEHGAIMAATVLNSTRAIQVSVYVVEVFIKLRDLLVTNHKLARKLAELETELKARMDVQEAAIVDILRRLMEILDPPALPEPPPKQFGFQVRETRASYHTRRDKIRTQPTS
jgi:hypothetical protein